MPNPRMTTAERDALEYQHRQAQRRAAVPVWAGAVRKLTITALVIAGMFWAYYHLAWSDDVRGRHLANYGQWAQQEAQLHFDPAVFGAGDPVLRELRMHRQERELAQHAQKEPQLEDALRGYPLPVRWGYHAWKGLVVAALVLVAVEAARLIAVKRRPTSP